MKQGFANISRTLVWSMVLAVLMVISAGQALAVEPKGELKPNEVALALYAGDVGLHIGFVFCPEGGSFKFLHLAFHHLLRIEECPLYQCSIIGKLPFKQQSLKYLRHALGRIGTDMPKIPYGVRIARKKGLSPSAKACRKSSRRCVRQSSIQSARPTCASTPS